MLPPNGRLPDALEGAGLRQPGARFALLVFTTVNVLNFMDRTVPNAVKEPMIRDFNLTDAESALPQTFGLLSYIVCGQIVGWLVDSRAADPRTLLSWAVFAWSLATLMVGCSQSLKQLILCRVIVNGAESAFSGIAYPLLADFYPLAERPAAFAVVLGAIPFGCAAGFGLGGVLGDWYGWRAAMFLVGLPGISLAFVINFVSLPPRGINDISNPVAVVAARETSEHSGVSGILGSYREILARSHWTVCASAVVMMSLAMSASSEWMATYLIRVRGIAIQDVGIVVGSSLVIGGCLGTMFGGHIAQHLATSYQSAYFLAPALLLMPGTACFAGALNVATNASSSFLWLACAMFFGFSYQAPATTIMMNAIPAHLRSRAMALYAFSSRAFDILGPLGIGIVSDYTDLQTAMQLIWIMTLPPIALWWSGYFLLAPLPIVQTPEKGVLAVWTLFEEDVISQGLAGGKPNDYGSTV